MVAQTGLNVPSVPGPPVLHRLHNCDKCTPLLPPDRNSSCLDVGLYGRTAFPGAHITRPVGVQVCSENLGQAAGEVGTKQNVSVC